MLIKLKWLFSKYQRAFIGSFLLLIFSEIPLYIPVTIQDACFRAIE